ncbi:unnamed protein product [Cuscuta epithymum]|uniref:Uncharacterized protein n=1 Tax=Cuscuta epithymum TaxID=186058 RepID=A0AAV0D630_9ASTE|nr:unnamed protein product [Cuscuta epithymum]
MTGMNKCRRSLSYRAVAAASSSLLLLFMAVAAFAVTAEAGSSSPDYNVIMELRKSIGLTSDADCSYAKIPCDCGAEGSGLLDVRCDLEGRGRVTYLTFQGASGGSLPASLENLPELSIFEAPGKNLHGAIPNFGEAIWEISLHDNHFTEIVPQKLFESKPQLSMFVLSNNPSLNRWAIPDALKGSPKLDYFSADGCNMEGPFPGIFTPANFPLLRVLTLSSNSLTGSIPESIAELTQLQTLDVSNNQLTGSVPDSTIANLISLWHLNLANNQLTGPIPSALAGLDQLEQIDLSNNQFNGSIPLNIASLTNLTHLRLSNNQLTGDIPQNLASLPQLDLIDLSNNQFTGTVPNFPSTVTVIACGNAGLSGGQGGPC